MASVSAVVLEAISAAGCKHLFDVPGDALNALIEAERKQHAVRFIHMRHEEAGAFAASAQAKLTGGLGACMGTAGPGAIHLLDGLYDAKRDRAPVLAITGQVSTAMLGTDYHQEVNTLALFSNVAVFNAMVERADDATRLVREAIEAALRNRGVAHLSLPLDVAGQNVGHHKLVETQLAASEKNSEGAGPSPRPADAASSVPTVLEQKLEEAAALIANSERPLILAGIGALHARDELIELARRIGAPIIKSLRAKELLADEDPLCIGLLGLLGTRPAVQAAAHCDLLLLIGTDFPYKDFYPEHKPALQIDIRAEELGHRYTITVGLAGDAKSVLTELLSRIPQRNGLKFLEEYQVAMRRWLNELDEVERDIRDPIQPQRLARLAGEHAPDDAIFCCDTGTVTYWSARNLRLRDSQRFTFSANLASMGFALPGAIGAQLAYPQRQAIALVGDGGLAMTLGELMTLAQHELPVKVIVFNNRKLGLIQVEQEARGLPEYQTGLSDADFAAIARGCGIAGRRVDDPAHLDEAIRDCYAAPGPYLLDVLVRPDELTVPPVIHWDKARGYSLAKVKEFFGLGDSGEA